MIESWLFVLAMIAVLMIPGPTNALLASSAHQQGPFGRAILSGESKQIKADLLYKGSAMLLVVCMFPVILRFFA